MKFAGIAMLTAALSGQTPMESNRLVQTPQKKVEAITASLRNPIGIAVDRADNVLFTDRNQ